MYMRRWQPHTPCCWAQEELRRTQAPGVNGGATRGRPAEVRKGIYRAPSFFSRSRAGLDRKTAATITEAGNNLLGSEAEANVDLLAGG